MAKLYRDFICCSRKKEDAPDYWHPCECPSARLVTKSKTKVAELCGFSEYTGDDVAPSVPPKKYKREYKFSRDISGEERQIRYCRTFNTEVHEPDGTCVVCNESQTFSSNCSEGNLGGGNWSICVCSTIDMSYSLQNFVTQTSSFSSSETDRRYDEDCNVTGGVTFDSGGGDRPDFPDCDGDTISLSLESTENNFDEKFQPLKTISNTERSQNYSYSIVEKYGIAREFSVQDKNVAFFGTICVRTQKLSHNSNLTTTFEVFETNTLSEEDTEEAALERDEWSESDLSISTWEIRATGFSFRKQTVEYAVILTGLLPGIEYSGGVGLESGEAIADEQTVFEQEDDILISNFIATKQYEIIGGTLNVSEEDFIDNDYSTTPSDYGLDNDDLVVIPNTELFHERGVAYNISSPYIEKSL